MRAQILQPTPGNLALAAEALLQGAPVAMPTETVYGLAGSALNPLAVARIFETKDRPIFDPLIVHIGIGHTRLANLERSNLIDISKFSTQAQAIAEHLMTRFWPGPLTLIFPKHESISDLVTGGLASIAIRMPRHPVAQALIAACGTPLAAPSANRFGRISPTCAADVAQELGDRIDFIVDGGPCEVGVESTILSIGESAELTLLRPGGLPLEMIEKEVLQKGVSKILRAPKNTAIQAPGMLESHYAPRKPVFLLAAPLAELKEIPKEWKLSGRIGLLTISGSEAQASEKFQALTGMIPLCRTLSPSGNMTEAAHNLFQSLRAFDQSDIIAIVSEPCSEETGLGHAIGDRLRRAAAPRTPGSAALTLRA